MRFLDMSTLHVCIQNETKLFHRLWYLASSARGAFAGVSTFCSSSDVNLTIKIPPQDVLCVFDLRRGGVEIMNYGVGVGPSSTGCSATC